MTCPWILAKDEGALSRLGTVLYNLAECLRFIGVMLRPFLTRTAPEIFRQLGVEDGPLTEIAGLSRFGALVSGTMVKKGGALFPRIDIKKELEALEAEFIKKEDASSPADAENPCAGGHGAPVAAAKEAAVADPDKPEYIEYEDFAKLDLRLAKVVACELVKKSDHLLQLTLEVGDSTRTVLSGIRDWYAPDDLIGRTVVLVANLRPKKLRGVLKGRTTFIIAHRISSVMNADQIIVLDHGEIAERGTHRELMELGGIYANMVAEQTANMVDEEVG